MHDRSWQDLPGRLIVISGASGSGKSSLLAEVLARPDLSVQLSISATTRPPRAGEVDGRHYFFWDRPRFEAAIADDAFLEWAEVHGNLYGTPAGPVHDVLSDGTDVILEIDVQGALLVKRRLPEATSLFIHAPSFEVLEQRLRARSTDDEQTIQVRLQNARDEIAQATNYDHQIINDDFQRAVDELSKLIRRPS